MIITDNLLEARERAGRPIRVGIIGAGFMAQGLVNTIVNSVAGMRVTAIYGRRLERAEQVYEYAGLGPTAVVSTQSEFEDAVAAGGPVITDDPALLCCSDQIDALVDVTGSVELGAHVALEAFRHGKHVILMNAELDATIGVHQDHVLAVRDASSTTCAPNSTEPVTSTSASICSARQSRNASSVTTVRPRRSASSTSAWRGDDGARPRPA